MTPQERASEIIRHAAAGHLPWDLQRRLAAEAIALAEREAYARGFRDGEANGQRYALMPQKETPPC